MSTTTGGFFKRELVGKSVSWVKLIESGRRKIQEADQATLRQVFGVMS